MDRAKDVIISGGENIYPAELEIVLREHPSIADVAIVGTQDQAWGEVPCAVVVPKADADVTLASLRTFCEGKLARFKQVRRLVLRTEPLPRNASGKVLKHELRAALAQAGEPEGQEVLPT